MRCVLLLCVCWRCRCRLQLLNVLAAVHHQLGKHHVAALYLSTALAQQQAAYCKQQGLPSSQDAAKQQQQQGTDRRQQGSGKQKQSTGKQQGGKGNAAKGKSQPAAAEQQQQQQQQDAAEPRSSRWLLPDDSNALQYNLGLQQLALQNWQGALECFEAASCSLYIPQLWLRLAEATLSLYHEQQEQQQQQLPVLIQAGQQQQRAGSSDTGSQPGAALLQQAAEQLSTGLSLLRQQQAEAAKQAEEAAAAMTAAAAAAAAAGGFPLAEQQGAAWLGAANQSSLFDSADAAGGSSELAGFGSSSRSMLNASLFGGVVAAAAAAASAGPGSCDALGSAAAAPGGITPLDVCMLPPGTAAVQQALLANQAYVHLLLQQPLPALEAAKALLACSSMSPQQHYLGSCYAAEALCLLGRTEDAAEQLQGHMALYMSSSSAAVAAPPDHDNSSSSFGADVTSSAAAAAAAAAVASGVSLVHAGSIMSDDDGSCAGCRGSGPCSILTPGHSPAGSSSMVQQRERQTALLCNMSSVLAMQGGDLQESRRYAALAAAQDPACGGAQLLLELTGHPAVQLGGLQA
jgi:hypothetical protein